MEGRERVVGREDWRDRSEDRRDGKRGGGELER